MNTLSVFVDESGDFGKYEPHSPCYLCTLVFHDQSHPIYEHTQRLEERLAYSSVLPSHCFHTMPIIRREFDYKYMNDDERRKLLAIFMSFTRSLPITYTTFLVEKRQLSTPLELTISLSYQISAFIGRHPQLFYPYERIIVYYDNGQIELNRVLHSSFSIMFQNIEHRRASPSQYRLCQVADLCCTLELIAHKNIHGLLSRSERAFFSNDRNLYKNYLKPLQRMKIL